MTLFWLGAAVLTLVVLGMVLPTLLGWHAAAGADAKALNLAVYADRLGGLEAAHARGELDDEDFRQAMTELDRSLLDDVGDRDETSPDAVVERRGRWLAAVVAVALPAAGVAVYVKLGAADGLGPGAAQSLPATADASGVPPVEVMVEQLERRLDSRPDDIEGWLTLGRTYVVLQRYADAATAYARAHDLAGDDRSILVDYAEAMAMADGNQLDGEAGRLARRALELAPGHPKALWLVGFAERQVGNVTAAIALWRQLIGVLPEGSDQRRVVEQLVAAASGDASPDGPAAVPETTTAPVADASIEVNVALSEELAEQAGASDRVYVFARAVDGPPMPVAIARLRAGDLPATVVLDDTASMMPSVKLSNFSRVVIGARVSRTGDPLPGSGDLQGVSGVVEVGALEGPVEIRIDHRIP